MPAPTFAPQPALKPVWHNGAAWRWSLCLTAACLLALPAALAAAAAPTTTAPGTARVVVDFVQPERYSDASDSLGRAGGDVEVLDTLKAQIESSALACLTAGQTLSVHVLDVDLAGDYEWWHRRFSPGVRVLRERDWPRIELSYRVANDAEATTAAGNPPTEQHEVVSDMAYLSGARPLTDGRLSYERAMLARWVQRRVCVPGAR
jgi:hypothetical protein